MHVGFALGLVEGDGVRRVRAKECVGCRSLVGEKGGGADTDGIGKVRRDISQGGVTGLRIEGYDAHRDVVAVDERDVVEGLAAVRCQGEFRKGCGWVSLSDRVSV